MRKISAFAFVVPLFLALDATHCVAQAPASTAATASSPTITSAPKSIVVARVNGDVVSQQELVQRVQMMLRQKFYHGNVPLAQMKAITDDALEGIILRKLLVGEATKRKIEVNTAEIEKSLQGYEVRYANSEQWKKTRIEMLPKLRLEMTEQDLSKKIEAAIKLVPEPSEADVRAHYDANLGLFTEPVQYHVSVLLLKVDPSAGKTARESARSEARGIHTKLVKGVSFAELAKVHSAHASASKGGDMGYLHAGMLPEALDTLMQNMKPGQLSQPTDLLEGVALLKLNARKDAALRKYPDVRERATALLKRERAEKAWNNFVGELRAKAVVVLNQEALSALAGTPPGAATAPPHTEKSKSTSDQPWQPIAPSGSGKGAG